MDRSSLRDAINAERLAAPIRSASAFLAAQVRVEANAYDSYVHNRTESMRHALSGTDADVQWALEQADQLWYSAVPFRDPVRIVSQLTAHARSLIDLDGKEMILRVDREEPGREILRWRFVSLALPSSILIAAATPQGVPPPAAVRLLHRTMAPDAPAAHQHVHHAAMVSFEELWVGLRLRALLEPGRFWEGFRDKRAFCPHLHHGVCIGGRGKDERKMGKAYPYARQKHLIQWGAMVRLAFFGRRILQRHLLHSSALARCHMSAAELRMVSSLLTGRSIPYAGIAPRYPAPDELVALRRSQRDCETKFDRSAALAPGSDFTARLAAEERTLLVRAFHKVASIGPVSTDNLYEKLLLQYLRVKSAVFGLLVHPPGEHGLEKFLEHFLQIKVYAPDADIVVPRRPEEPGLKVGATEYRVAPDAWFKVRRRAEIERVDTRDTRDGGETGWLIHFKRQAAEKQLPLHIVAVRSMDAEADQIARHLEAEPKQLETLRGIDICGVEEAQPCWVVADTLRRLRLRSKNVAARNAHLKVHPLRLTLHAGEDFQWLTSGVRAMAEPFVWRLLQRGDRIGHGIAITLEPRKWWSQKRHDVVPLKRFDRFLNLAFLAEYVPAASRDQMEWLRESITRLVKELHLEPLLSAPSSAAVHLDVVAAARKFWLCLGSATTRRLMASPDFAAAGDGRHRQWLHRYLWTPSIHELADEVIPMRLEDDRVGLTSANDRNERDLLAEARKAVIRQLARWQVCIESNPSSNLVVGSLESMLAQDFLHRRPTSPAEQEGEETLMWTISTDDPITFSTTLADEYAYAWAGMVLRKDKPYDPAYARALLDEAAATSMRTRFTIPADEAKREDNRRGRQRRRRR